MVDETTATTETAAAKAKREKQATHYWLASDGSDKQVIDGKVTDKWLEQEQATGYRYVSESGFKFDYQVPGALIGSVTTMLALFGAKTLAINTASAARQADADQLEALNSRFTKELYEGHWADERTGGGRAYDEETIIAAVVQVAGSKGATPENVAAKIKALPGGLQAYAKNAMTNPQVNAAYNKIKGKVAAKVDTLF